MLNRGSLTASSWYLFFVLFVLFQDSFITAYCAHADDTAQLEVNVTETKKNKARLAPRSTRQQIKGLEITSEKPRVTIEISGDQVTHTVTLEGHYDYPEHTLFADYNKLSIDSEGNFTTSYEIKPNQTGVEFYAVSPRGNIEKEIIAVEFSEWESPKPKEPPGPKIDPNMRRWYYFAGLGVTSLTYTEYDYNKVPAGVDEANISYKALALTAKGGINYLLRPPRWEASALGYITAFTISKSANVTTEGRFMGLNLRLGYTFDSIKEPWKITLYGGYYVTAATGGTQFGYQGFGGPQLYPSIRYKFSKSKMLTTYVKYAPVSDGFIVLKPSTSREVAAGLAFTMLQKHNKSFSFNLDLADLKAYKEEISTNITSKLSIHSSSITFGATYGF